VRDDFTPEGWFDALLNSSWIVGNSYLTGLLRVVRYPLEDTCERESPRSQNSTKLPEEVALEGVTSQFGGLVLNFL